MLILLFTMQIVKSQSFDKKSSWTTITTNLFDDTFAEISTYIIDGDTLIGDKSYSKIFRNDNFYSALRETDDNKIYAYFPEPFLYPARELLIYDFDWYPGKKLYFQAAFADSVALTVLGSSIDSIQLLDGKYYQYFDIGNFRQIRGIGNMRGFFFGIFEVPADGSQYSLLCFYIDDILVYSNPDFNYCNFNSINMITNNDSHIKLYPNPSNHSITVEFLENLTVDTFQLFDTKGSLIKTYEVGGKSKVEVQHLAKGIYAYVTILKNNQKLSGKIIIQ